MSLYSVLHCIPTSAGMPVSNASASALKRRRVRLAQFRTKSHVTGPPLDVRRPDYYIRAMEAPLDHELQNYMRVVTSDESLVLA